MEQGGDEASKQLHDRFDPRKFKFDIRKAPLLRVYIAHDADHERWLMVKLVHHLVGDNTSLRLIFQEIQAHLHLDPRFDLLPF